MGRKEEFITSLGKNTTKDSLFEVAEGKPYIRYDQIRVKQTELDVVQIDYYWRGEKVFWQIVDMINFSEGKSLMLSNIDGRAGIEVIE